MTKDLTIFDFLKQPIGIGSPDLTILDLIVACFIFMSTVVVSRLFTRFLKRTIFVRARINVGVQESIALCHYGLWRFVCLKPYWL